MEGLWKEAGSKFQLTSPCTENL